MTSSVSAPRPDLASLLPAPPSATARETQVIASVEDCALQIRDRLKSEPEAAPDVMTLARALKQRGIAEAAAVPGVVTAPSVRQAALAALQGGMMCGALDGLLMLCAGQAVAEPSLEVPASLHPQAELLTSGMGKARAVAQDQWSTMPMDDLQLLAGYGKHQNLHTGDESQAQVGRPADDTATWLMATFKAGYAIGLADGVILARGENPDPTA